MRSGDQALHPSQRGVRVAGIAPERSIGERQGFLDATRVERPPCRQSQDDRVVGILPEGPSDPGIGRTPLAAVDQECNQLDRDAPIAGLELERFLIGPGGAGGIVEVVEGPAQCEPDAELARPEPRGHLEQLGPAAGTAEIEVQLTEGDGRLELIGLQFQGALQRHAGSGILLHPDQGQPGDRHRLAGLGRFVVAVGRVDVGEIELGVDRAAVRCGRRVRREDPSETSRPSRSRAAGERASLRASSIALARTRACVFGHVGVPVGPSGGYGAAARRRSRRSPRAGHPRASTRRRSAAASTPTCATVARRRSRSRPAWGQPERPLVLSQPHLHRLRRRGLDVVDHRSPLTPIFDQLAAHDRRHARARWRIRARRSRRRREARVSPHPATRRNGTRAAGPRSRRSRRAGSTSGAAGEAWKAAEADQRIVALASFARWT